MPKNSKAKMKSGSGAKGAKTANRGGKAAIRRKSIGKPVAKKAKNTTTKTIVIAAVSGFPTEKVGDVFLIDVRNQKGEPMHLKMDFLTAQWLVENMREQFRLRRIQ